MKIIRIEKCGECPHVYPEDGGYDACYLLFEGDRVLVNYDTIHPDCPLEDAGELAELREKAAKWDRIMEAVEDPSCEKCPIHGLDKCGKAECDVVLVADALNGEVKDEAN